MALNLSGRRPRASSPSPWHAIAAALTLISVPAAGGIQAAGLDPSAPSVPLGHYTTSWLGNSYGGPNWVQRYCNDLYTAPDGTCYGATAWDEGGREFGIYRNGQVVGKADMSHGWGYGGGSAVTANSHYMFVAQTVSHLGNNPDDKTYPPKGSSWFGIGRRHLDGSAAPFPGGEGHTATADGGPFLAMNTVAVPLAAGAPSPGITSLAASETQVFAANPVDGQIDIFNAETMAKSGEFALANVKHIAFDPATSTLWAWQQGAGAARIGHFNLTGGSAGPDIPLPAGTVPSAFCLAPSHELLVADSGPAQQVLIFQDVDTHPRLSGTLGVKGGILSGVPGQVEPLKFSNPSGIGADAQGNIYVASDESGLVLESYAPTGTRNWEMHGLEFVECADIDPASSNDAYTQEHHYVLDLAKPSGQDSIYTGYLVNSAKYPEDPRANGYGCGSIFVRRLAGKKFLFGLDMNAGTLEIFRFTGEGEETAPSGLIRLYSRPGTKPTNQPAGAGCIWRDANGDGHFDTSEYELWNQSQGTTCWSIDTHGDIWTEGLASNDKSGDQHFMIRRLPFQGLDSLGNPIYSFKTETEVVAPEPFAVRAKGNGPERIQYVPESDTMYISGFTTDHPNQYRDWKTSGPVICCYDHWSTTPVLRWQIVVPFESVQVPHTTAHCPDAISVAGDRLFNGYAANGEIRVYDTHDGSYLGSLLPGPEVDHTSGWIDTMYGVRANQLADGSYLVFAEEVWHEKVLMYKWDGGK